MAFVLTTSRKFFSLLTSRRIRSKVVVAKLKKRRLFRDAGAGRKMDDWWAKGEPVLIRRFKTHRDAGAIVLRSHLFVWTIEICCEVGVDLEQLKLERKWKNFRANLRQRIRSFCSRHGIKMKRRQPPSLQGSTGEKYQTLLFYYFFDVR